MIALLVFITCLLFLIYGVCILTLTYGWMKLKNRLPAESSSGSVTRVSVIVAMKDEEENIGVLLQHLTLQDYPRHLFEIILADDHSEDDTLKVIKRWQHNSDMDLRVVCNASGETGKKVALSKGIDSATGELIMITDADCIMGNRWIGSVVSFYEKENPYMILGPVLYKSHKRKPFECFQALEFISLLAVSAGAASLNRPLFCNAANMAFTRQVYNEFRDPFSSETASGDDTMLLLSIKKKYPGKIRFNKHRYALVETFPEKTLKRFWNQRKRWVSKSKYYSDFDILFVSYNVFATNLLLLVFFVLMLFHASVFNFFLGFFLFKFIIDSFLLFPLILYYKIPCLLLSYVPSQLIYFLYATSVALGGKFSGFEWKNRYYHVN